MADSFDVVIIGAGLAGLTAALQLKRTEPTASVAVLERARFPYPEAAHKVGESSVEIGAMYFSEVLGLEKHLVESQLPKFGLRIFFRDEAAGIGSRFEFGSRDYFQVPTYQIDRGRFENFLAQQVRSLGVEIIEGVKVTTIDLDSSTSHSVKFRDLSANANDEESRLSARWIIDASGRAAILRRKLNLSEESPHHASSAWFRVGTEIRVDDWVDDSNWRGNHSGKYARWYSTNHLMGTGYWVWLIPLASGSTSIGIVADPRFHPLEEFNTKERALSWLQSNEPECYAAIQPHQDKILDFIARKNYSHWCKQVISEDRWSIVGDAGIFLDPFYSPGSDFIALGNTFVTDLISRDLNNELFMGRARLYDQLYLSFAQNTLSVFLNQYEIFGNPEVMTTKVIWDYATYWGFLAFVFSQSKFTDISSLTLVRAELETVSELNREVQRALRDWNSSHKWRVHPHYVDVCEIPWLMKLNSDLRERFSDQEFIVKMREHTNLLKDLADEIKSQIAADVIPRAASDSSDTACDLKITAAPFLQSLNQIRKAA